jgi:serine/threonine-protein kinase
MSQAEQKPPGGSDTELDELHELVGREFLGRYRIESVLGKGGMSVVFKALHLKMDRTVAVKVLARNLMQDEEQVKSFNKEAFACSRLQHPNTIRVFDFGESADGFLFMVMELLQGEALGDLLRREGRLGLVRSFHIARQVCKSLAEAHSIGIVHGDVKPDNVFITNIHGEQDYAKVMDFGIARFMDKELSDEGAQTGGGKIWGSPLYLCPEQFLENPVGPQSDLYAVGCVLYEMLTGVPPFFGKKALDVVMGHLERQPRPPSELAPDLDLPKEVDALVLQLLAKDPAERPKTGDHAVTLMDKALESAGVIVGSKPTTGQIKTSGRGASVSVPKNAKGPKSTEEASKALDFRWVILGLVTILAGLLIAILSGSETDAPPPPQQNKIGQTNTTEQTGTKPVPAKITPEKQAPPQAKPSEPSSYQRTILIQTVPAGADVTVDGLELGTTPLSFRYDEAANLGTLTIILKGYKDAELVLSADFIKNLPDQGLKLELAKREVKPRAKPRPKPKNGPNWKSW